MQEIDFDPEEIRFPGQDAVRIFENDLGGITVAQEGEQSSLVAFNVDGARRVAAALLRVADRIETEQKRYEDVREQKLLEERIRRASNP